MSTFCQTSKSDKAIVKIDSAINDGSLYKAILKKDNTLNVYNSFGDVIFKSSESYSDFSFEDFNKDGNSDLLISYKSNNNVKDLFLFEPKAKIFKTVADFKKIFKPLIIRDTKYFCAFHSNGCSDKDWESDLFIISDYKIIRIGNITVKSCEKNNEKNGIFIYKVNGENKSLLETKPVDLLNKNEDFKWIFYPMYWEQNYKLFSSLENKNCQKLIHGKFKILADSYGNETIIERKGDIQVETVDNISYKFVVKWIDDCTYTLTPTIETTKLFPNLPKNAILTIKILEVKEDSYIQNSTANWSDKVDVNEIYIMK